MSQLYVSVNGQTVTYTLLVGFRKSYTGGTPTLNSLTSTGQTFQFSDVFYYGDGTSVTSITYTVASINTKDDFLLATATLSWTYATAGTYTAYITMNARSTGSTVRNNAGANLRLQSEVAVGLNSYIGSPIVTGFPTVVRMFLSFSGCTSSCV